MSGLFGSAMLEVAIGLFFIYMLLSLVCSSLNEYLATVMKWRARDLFKGIENLLCDPALANQVINHPLIRALGNTHAETPLIQSVTGITDLVRNLFKRGSFRITGIKDLAGKPDYIPASTFALALFNTLVPADSGRITIEQVRDKALDLVQVTPEDLQVQLDKLKDFKDRYKPEEIQAIKLEIEKAKDPDLRKAIMEIKRSPATQYLIDHIDGRQAIAQALLTLIDQSQVSSAVMANWAKLKDLVKDLPADHPMRSQILEWMKSRDDQLEAARHNVEAWFDQSMDQVKGIYKRRVQAWLFALALGVSLVIGADTIKIIKTLSANATLRTFVANEAVQTTKPGGPLSMTTQASPANTQPISTTVVTTTSANITTTTTSTTAPTISAVADEIEKLNQLLGYSDMPKIGAAEWPGAVEAKIVGILITTLAVSLGAPFWFDLLQKVANIRAAGRRPESVTD